MRYKSRFHEWVGGLMKSAANVTIAEAAATGKRNPADAMAEATSSRAGAPGGIKPATQQPQRNTVSPFVPYQYGNNGAAPMNFGVAPESPGDMPLEASPGMQSVTTQKAPQPAAQTTVQPVQKPAQTQRPVETPMQSSVAYQNEFGPRVNPAISRQGKPAEPPGAVDSGYQSGTSKPFIDLMANSADKYIGDGAGRDIRYWYKKGLDKARSNTNDYGDEWYDMFRDRTKSTALVEKWKSDFQQELKNPWRDPKRTAYLLGALEAALPEAEFDKFKDSLGKSPFEAFTSGASAGLIGGSKYQQHMQDITGYLGEDNYAAQLAEWANIGQAITGAIATGKGIKGLSPLAMKIYGGVVTGVPAVGEFGIKPLKRFGSQMTKELERAFPALSGYLDNDPKIEDAPGVGNVVFEQQLKAGPNVPAADVKNVVLDQLAENRFLTEVQKVKTGFTPDMSAAEKSDKLSWQYAQYIADNPEVPAAMFADPDLTTEDRALLANKYLTKVVAGHATRDKGFGGILGLGVDYLMGSEATAEKALSDAVKSGDPRTIRGIKNVVSGFVQAASEQGGSFNIDQPTMRKLSIILHDSSQEHVNEYLAPLLQMDTNKLKDLLSNAGSGDGSASMRLLLSSPKVHSAVSEEIRNRMRDPNQARQLFTAYTSMNKQTNGGIPPKYMDTIMDNLTSVDFDQVLTGMETGKIKELIQIMGSGDGAMREKLREKWGDEKFNEFSNKLQTTFQTQLLRRWAQDKSLTGYIVSLGLSGMGQAGAADAWNSDKGLSGMSDDQLFGSARALATGQGASGLSEEDQALYDKFKGHVAGMYEDEITERVKKNPFGLLPRALAAKLYSKGGYLGQIGEFMDDNPWSFYAGIAALLGIGGAMFADDGDEDEDEDYDPARISQRRLRQTNALSY